MGKESSMLRDSDVHICDTQCTTGTTGTIITITYPS